MSNNRVTDHHYRPGSPQIHDSPSANWCQLRKKRIGPPNTILGIGHQVFLRTQHRGSRGTLAENSIEGTVCCGNALTQGYESKDIEDGTRHHRRQGRSST